MRVPGAGTRPYKYSDIDRQPYRAELDAAYEAANPQFNPDTQGVAGGGVPLGGRQGGGVPRIPPQGGGGGYTSENVMDRFLK